MESCQEFFIKFFIKFFFCFFRVIKETRYIVTAKLQESKLLLAYSDRPLSEISNFFFFSSQSYFQNLFKRQFGITPLAYRKRPHKE